MTKLRLVFACQACGFESSKWLGRCPECGEWNSFLEERQEATPAAKGRPAPGIGGRPKPYSAVDGTEAMRERGYLAIRGRRVPVAGSVCMDLTMVDLTDHPEVGDWEEAVLFGDSPTAWDVADWAGTTAWQVLTAVGARVPRVYVEDGRVVEVDSPYL